MKYYLGIDQGGTKTQVAVCDELGRILGFGYAKGLVSVHFQDTEEVFLQNIRAACEQALGQAGLRLTDVTTVCAALNGADWGFEYMTLSLALVRVLGCSDVILVNDCIGAMRGGSLRENCGVVCAGTGCNIALCRENADNLIYGYFVPEDLQGGGALGHLTFDAVLEAYTGVGPQTCLTQAVLEYTGYASVKQLFMDMTLGRYELAYPKLAPSFLRACVAGDAAAVRIAERFAERAARFVCAAVEKQGMENEALDVVFSGSVFKDNGVYITRSIAEKLRAVYPQINCIDAAYEPVCGCLLEIFRRTYDECVPAEILENFARSASGYPVLRDTILRDGEVRA